MALPSPGTASNPVSSYETSGYYSLSEFPTDIYILLDDTNDGWIYLDAGYTTDSGVSIRVNILSWEMTPSPQNGLELESALLTDIPGTSITINRIVGKIIGSANIQVTAVNTEQGGNQTRKTITIHAKTVSCTEKYPTTCREFLLALKVFSINYIKSYCRNVDNDPYVSTMAYRPITYTAQGAGGAGADPYNSGVTSHWATTFNATYAFNADALNGIAVYSTADVTAKYDGFIQATLYAKKPMSPSAIEDALLATLSFIRAQIGYVLSLEGLIPVYNNTEMGTYYSYSSSSFDSSTVSAALTKMANFYNLPAIESHQVSASVASCSCSSSSSSSSSSSCSCSSTSSSSSSSSSSCSSCSCFFIVNYDIGGPL